MNRYYIMISSEHIFFTDESIDNDPQRVEPCYFADYL